MSKSPAKTCAHLIVKRFGLFADNDLARIAAEDDIEQIITEGFRKRVNTESDHALTIERWMVEWRNFFGESYTFTPKDAKAIKLLLSNGDNTPDQVLRVAAAAWRFRDSRRHFNCKFSTTITGLQSKWNEIRAELSLNEKPVTSHPRNSATY